jgi:hypothetical protein
MPTVTLGLDYAGRPVIELYVGASAAARDTLFAERPAPTPLALRALIDTGASRTLVEARVLTALGLDETGETEFRSATTGTRRTFAKLFAVSLLTFPVAGTA